MSYTYKKLLYAEKQERIDFPKWLRPKLLRAKLRKLASFDQVISWNVEI